MSLSMVALAGCMPPKPDDDRLAVHHEQTRAANQQPRSENQALQTPLAQQALQNTYTVAADMLFAPGSFDITRNGEAALNDIIGSQRGVKISKIIVYGYTDDQRIGPVMQKSGIGTNLDLSSKRAGTVADYLRAHGVDPGILSAEGRGETHPVAPNTTVAGRAQNRRVEIVVERAGN